MGDWLRTQKPSSISNMSFSYTQDKDAMRLLQKWAPDTTERLRARHYVIRASRSGRATAIHITSLLNKNIAISLPDL